MRNYDCKIRNKPDFSFCTTFCYQRKLGGTVCDHALYDVDAVSRLDLCRWLEELAENSAAMKRMISLFRYQEWRDFYDYLKSIEMGVAMWPMSSFDTHLIFRFCNVARMIYESTRDADFAYLYACILFDMAYEEIYEESLLDGIYTYVYQKADKAVEVLISAWRTTPNENTFIRVLWGYRHKRECHAVEYSESIFPERHPTPWVDEEIRDFLKSEGVTEEYLQLPDSIQLLQLLEG